MGFSRWGRTANSMHFRLKKNWKSSKLPSKPSSRVPVYAGTGCVTTKETIELSKAVQQMGGVDCLSIITPYFVKASQADLIEHYSAIAEAVDMPILLYNIPARTGNSIDWKTVKTTAKYENIIGIKDSSGNFDNMLKYIENTDPRLNVLAGSDSLILWALMAGGTGAMRAAPMSSRN